MPTTQPDHLRHMLFGQFQAALCMLHDCIRKCPPEHWDGTIGKYPFWQVVYHTLCFTDLYLTRDEAQFRPRDAEPQNFHPRGMQEFDDEYPSRRFTQAEMLAYTAVCREKLNATLGDGPGAESHQTLEGPTGHVRRHFSRAELHIYSLRHIQHHTGQLSAYLRRAGVDTDWVGSGWK